MVELSLRVLAEVVEGDLHLGEGSTVAETVVRGVATDSRGPAPRSCFFALQGQRTDGHLFLREAYGNGVAVAVVSRDRLGELDLEPGWAWIAVDCPLAALQRLAEWYRRRHLGPVLAITGSNGKTTVKEILLRQLASRRVASSPGSYNSQLGVALSVLGAAADAELGVFEAGVSAPGEMERLRRILRPGYGILTNVGMAHLASMGDRQTLAREKMALFRDLPRQGWLLLPADEKRADPWLGELACPVYRLGGAGDPVPRLVSSHAWEDGQVLEVAFPDGPTFPVRVATRSPEMVKDLLLAAAAAYLLGVEPAEIVGALDGFGPLPTRLEIWRSPEGVTLINDACSSDPISVEAALRTTALTAREGGRKLLVFGGMRELGEISRSEHAHVGVLAARRGFTHLFLVGGRELEAVARSFEEESEGGRTVWLRNTEELQARLRPLLTDGDTVLFKGPRNAGMVQAAQELSGSIARRLLTVDLGAVMENVARFRRHIGPGVEVLAMAKALSYGTNAVQLATWIARLGLDHVGVSSTYEGVEIRRSGVTGSIYVFMPEAEEVSRWRRYRLTPVLHSRRLVEMVAAAVPRGEGPLDVHLKVDSGMHRLGVAPEEAVATADLIRRSGVLRLCGLCTHFAAADDPDADALTRRQVAVFDEVVAQLGQAGFEGLRLHAGNTAAAARFPQARYDMVRIGLGLYGVYPSPAVAEAIDLELAISLTSRITQVRRFQEGDAIGYHHAYRTSGPARIGVVSCGYDDGIPWSLSNRGFVLVDGQRAAVVGSVSMDQMFVDITAIPGADVGTEVLLYGAHNGHVLRPEELAKAAGTMAHELLVRLGNRVQRVFVEPSGEA